MVVRILFFLGLVMELNGFSVIGHRGACGYAPENTLASFAKAIELGVDMVEFDVQRCKTGELVVLHDTKVNRTTNGKGSVGDFTLADLQKLDAGKGEQIPTLREVLDLVDREARVNIEIKQEGIVDDVAAIIKEYVTRHGWSEKDFLVSSFWHRELAAFKKIYPGVATSALFVCDPAGGIEFVSSLGVDAVGCSIEFISKELVQDVHARDKKIFLFTVNAPDEIRYALSLGVDGIFSDFPDRVLAAINR
jgi:glycerophosphoryl diester phosphodiesterase